jgi:hypothetical protein
MKYLEADFYRAEAWFSRFWEFHFGLRGKKVDHFIHEVYELWLIRGHEVKSGGFVAKNVLLRPLRPDLDGQDVIHSQSAPLVTTLTTSDQTKIPNCQKMASEVVRGRFWKEVAKTNPKW